MAGLSGSETIGSSKSNFMIRDGENPAMSEYANCLGVDPDLFFPERGASTREAKEVCRACVVQSDCLEYALENVEKFGIWGGTSERERRRMRRQRALARRGEKIPEAGQSNDITAAREDVQEALAEVEGSPVLETSVD